MSQRILVIEDEDAWSSSLGRFYADLGFQPVSTHDPEKALEYLRSRQFALGSFDIVLGRLEPGRPAPRYTGLDLLKRAAARKWIRGAVVISGAPTKQNLADDIPDEAKRRQVQHQLSDYCRDLFPGRVIVCQKQPDLTPKLNIDFWRTKGYLTKVKLEALASGVVTLVGPYTLDFRFTPGKVMPDEVRISNRGDNRKQQQQLFGTASGHDCELLYELARRRNDQERFPDKDHNGIVTDEETLKILKPDWDRPSSPQALREAVFSQITSVRRRLKQEGINPTDPSDLIERPRGGDGFMLGATVECHLGSPRKVPPIPKGIAGRAESPTTPKEADQRVEAVLKEMGASLAEQWAKISAFRTESSAAPTDAELVKHLGLDSQSELDALREQIEAHFRKHGIDAWEELPA